jgi:hypothetical protein
MTGRSGDHRGTADGERIPGPLAAGRNPQISICNMLLFKFSFVTAEFSAAWGFAPASRRE